MNNQSNPTQSSAEKTSRYLTMLVAGINFRKEDAINFANGSNQSLSFLREFDNKFDKHAIKIIGKASGVSYFIGYVPKEVLNVIVRTELENILYPEIDRVYI